MLANLYRFSAADFNRPIWTRELIQSAGAASVSVAASWQNNQGLPLLLKNWAITMAPGAAQFPIRGFLRLTDAADNVLAELAGRELTSTVVQTQIIGDRIEVVVPPKMKITALGIYNAGAAANTTSISIYGWYIPRGTLALP